MEIPVRARKFHFGAFEADLHSGELRKRGLRIKIHDQPFQVLAILLERSGEIVTREELRQRLWPADTFVDFDVGLNSAIKRLRDALADSAEHPRFIETLPRRGYRFVGTIESGPPDSQRNSKAKYAFLLKHWRRLAFIALAFAAVSVLLSLWLHRGNQTAALRVVPLSTLPGEKISPSFSPDGSQVAFGWNGQTHGAGFDLYVKVIGTETPLRLTSRPVKWLGPAWSPDGRSIAVARVGKQDSGIYLVPALGGPERKLTPLVVAAFSGISWSPDGKQLVFVDQADQSFNYQLNQLSLDSLERHVIDTGCAQNFSPAFSPRDDLLAYVCAESFGVSAINLWHVSARNTSLLYRTQGDINGLAWSHDGKRLAYSVESPRVPEGPGVYEIAIANADHRKKLSVEHNARQLVSSQGNALAYVQYRENVNIWALDLGNRDPQAHKFVTSTRTQIRPAISPDGNKVAFASDRSGSDEIWICDRDGSNPVQITSFGGPLTGTPRWSPDGKRLAFDSRATGEASVYTVDPGGIPHKLETGTHDNTDPYWSHDGRWIYFIADATSARRTIRKAPTQGGVALQITHDNAMAPKESPDGLYVYFLRSTGGKFWLWRVRPDGSDEQPVAGLPALDLAAWYPLESGIYFVENAGTDIQYFDLNTSLIRRVYRPEKPLQQWIGGLAVSPDGTWLLYSQVDESSSDLMLIENWR